MMNETTEETEDVITGIEVSYDGYGRCPPSANETLHNAFKL